jgi:hypothetical protein
LAFHLLDSSAHCWTSKKIETASDGWSVEFSFSPTVVTIQDLGVISDRIETSFCCSKIFVPMLRWKCFVCEFWSLSVCERTFCLQIASIVVTRLCAVHYQHARAERCAGCGDVILDSSWEAAGRKWHG